MNGAALASLMSAYEDMSRLIARTPIDQAGTLDELAQRARSSVHRLEAALGGAVGSAKLSAIVMPFVFWLDECVQRRMLDGRQNWVPLQQSELQRSDGGDAFFEQLRSLLLEGTPEPLVVVSFLLALREGFEGCYFDEPETLEEFRNQLRGRLPKFEESRLNQPVVRLPRTRPVWWGWVPLVGLPLIVHLLVALAAAIW